MRGCENPWLQGKSNHPATPRWATRAIRIIRGRGWLLIFNSPRSDRWIRYSESLGRVAKPPIESPQGGAIEHAAGKEVNVDPTRAASGEQSRLEHGRPRQTCRPRSRRATALWPTTASDFHCRLATPER